MIEFAHRTTLLTYLSKLDNRGNKHDLFWVTLRCLRWEILIIALPRVAFLALQIAQPFLIADAVLFVQTSPDQTSQNTGYGLIGGFAFVFIGSAVSVYS